LNNQYDVIIIGAGSFGISTGYQLAKQGVSVLLIDAHNPPHTSGSHHGSARIVRSAYTMGPSYVKLALRSIELWKSLADDASRNADQLEKLPIYDPIGVISIGPSGSTFIESKTGSCHAFGIPFEKLSAHEIEARWPGFSLEQHMEGLFEPEGGILYSENIITLYKTLSIQQGAVLLTNTKVERIESHEAELHAVVTDKGSFYAPKVLVSAGAWSAQVLPELKGIVQPYRKPIAWFDAPADIYGAPHFPAFIINNGVHNEYFGFPALDANGLKIGRHHGGHLAAADRPVPPFGAYPEDEQELVEALEKFLPKTGKLLRGQICLYENAPGEEFIIDEVPGRSNVWFAGGGSGHGFKFASGIGEALSIALTKGKKEYPLDWNAFTFKGVKE